MSKRLIIIQVALVIAGVVIALSTKGVSASLAALYGGGIALLNSMLLAWRVKRAGEVAKTNPKQSVYILYFGAVERFVVALVGLAVGLGAFKLDPIPALATFAIAQIAYFFDGQSKSH